MQAQGLYITANHLFNEKFAKRTTSTKNEVMKSFRRWN